MRNKLMNMLGGGGGGGGGNLGVILVRVWELGLQKNDLFLYFIEENVYIFIYCSLIFYTLFAVCKQSSQINITILIAELNIWAKI